MHDVVHGAGLAVGLVVVATVHREGGFELVAPSRVRSVLEFVGGDEGVGGIDELLGLVVVGDLRWRVRVDGASI